MHDDTQRPADTKWRHAGTGLSQTFKCAECEQFRLMKGRRLIKVTKGPSRGLRAHVCSQCVAQHGAL